MQRTHWEKETDRRSLGRMGQALAKDTPVDPLSSTLAVAVALHKEEPFQMSGQTQKLSRRSWKPSGTSADIVANLKISIPAVGGVNPQSVMVGKTPS